jgi:transposase-like protein
MSCGLLATVMSGVTIEQIAADFGVHPMTLHKWMRQADIDEGAKPGKSTSESG